jgi:hypothetical protein
LQGIWFYRSNESITYFVFYNFASSSLKNHLDPENTVAFHINSFALRSIDNKVVNWNQICKRCLPIHLEQLILSPSRENGILILQIKWCLEQPVP